MSIASLSSRALFAKTKMSFVQHLTDQEYSELAQAKNLVEFASYLKNKTPYGKAFEGVGGSGRLTRQHLEAIIRRMTLLYLEKIVRYADLSDSFVSEYYMMVHECECIIRRLRQPENYLLDSYFLYMPSGFFTSPSFDLAALEKARTASEIGKVLQNTPYEKLLGDALRQTEFGSSAHLVPENILYAHLYTKSAESFRKCLSKKEYDEVEKILAMFSDMLTVDTLYRILGYYRNDRDKLLLYVYRPSFTRFKISDREALLKAPNLEAFTEILGNTCYKGLVPFMKKENPHRFTANYVHAECRRMFSMSTNAVVSALCYRRRITFEADNLITLTEGVEAGAKPEQMLALLVR